MRFLPRFFTTIFILYLALLQPSIILAEDPTPTPTQSITPTPGTDNSAQKGEIEKKIKEYESKLNETRSQKNTLSSQIQYMDTQINLTELKAIETERKIVVTEKEIESLTSKIDGLDSSLDKYSESMLERIKADYKSRQASLLDIVLDSTNASRLVNRMKYYELARESNQKILLQVQEAKLTYEKQKELREKKVKELDSLTEQLQAQKQTITTQQGEKKVLLQQTQSDENTYAKLLEDARRQLSAFRTFVQSTGLGVIGANSLGTGEGGWYLSQRDERWAMTRMGSSNESILDVGCFITSISMIMRKDGVDFNPSNIATNSKYFLPGTAYMYIPSAFNGSWPNGKNYKNISSGQISGYLERGIPVIAGVRNSSHYIVLKKNDNGGYIMNDPIYGPDKKVSDYYSLSGPYGVFE